MRRLIGIVGLMCLLYTTTNAQRHEIGVGAGTSNFMGDLGKQESSGNWYFNNLQASLFKPAFKVFYRYSITRRFALNASLNIGFFEGDDRLAEYDQIQDDNWYRNYRNLHFKSVAIEASATLEFNILKFAPGDMDNRWTPYVFAGIGLLHFNPKTEYDGEWIRLQPLGTEGQGMPGYGKKYSLLTPTLPIGLGLKFNATRFMTLAFEFGHRVTFTDHIDDVSGVYPEKDDLFGYYGTERATTVYELSRRSPELDPDGEFGFITEGGEFRGNPSANDSYLFSMLTISFNISKASNGQYFWRKKGQPFDRKSKKLKKYRKSF